MSPRARAAAVAALALLTALLVPAPALAGAANLGPVVRAVPVTVSGGGHGTAALDALVAAGCNAGKRLADPRWFTIAPGAAQSLVAESQVAKSQLYYRYQPELFTTRTAVVDLTTQTLVRCSGGPVARSTSHALGVVVWLSEGDLDGYLFDCRQVTIGCDDPEATLSVGPSTQSVAPNDDPAHAVAVASVPVTLSGDSTGATSAETVVGGSWPTPGCTLASGVRVDQATVWWRWTATYSGPLVARLDTELPAARILVAEQTTSGLQPIDYQRAPDVTGCVTGSPSVVSGRIYLIGVSTTYDLLFDQRPIPAGGRFQLFLGAPGVPGSVGLSASSSDASSASLAWSGTGASSGTSATTSFRVTRTDPSGSLVVATVPATTRTYGFTGLAASTTYTVSVQGVSSSGAGMPDFLQLTTGSSLTSATGPANAVDASVTAATGAATLSWSPPLGASGITGYVVSRDGTDKNGAGPWSATVGAATRSLTFSALVAGSTYQLGVQPVTASGRGPVTSVAVLVLPTAEKPASPQRVVTSVNASARSVDVTWSPPWYDGEAAVTGYDVLISPVGGSGGAGAGLAAGARSYTFSGLQDEVAYLVTVAAINAAGTGTAASVMVPPMNWKVPSSPYALAANPVDAAAVLSWHAPDQSGTFPVSSYVVTVYEGTTTTVATTARVTAPSTSVKVGGLTNGASYSFDVVASNLSDTYLEGGLSYPSARSSVFVPAKPPQPVITVPQGPRIKSVAGSVVKGRTVATVRWAAPANGGKPILGYRVYAYKVDASGHVLSSSRSTTISASRRSWSMTFSGVSRYRFAMRAVNAIGWSAYGGLSTTMAPASAPSAPRMGRATSGVPGGAVTASVTWSAPRSNGGTVVTGYRVFIYQLSAGGDVLSVMTSSLLKASARSWTGRLPTAGPYAFVVRAVNAMGQSRASARSSTVTGR